MRRGRRTPRRGRRYVGSHRLLRWLRCAAAKHCLAAVAAQVVVLQHLHGATDQVRKLVRQGAALKVFVAVLALHKQPLTGIRLHKVRVHRVLGSTGPRSSCHRTLPRRAQTGLSSNWPCTARNAGAEGACTTCYKPCSQLIICINNMQGVYNTNSEHGPCSKSVNNTLLTTFVAKF